MFADTCFANSTLIELLFLPLLIFLARVLDVSMGTLRIIFISRGFKYLAPFIAFLEILVWLLAITQIMRNLNNLLYYIAFAAGFATGTYVGIWFENKLAMGAAILRLIVTDLSPKLTKALKTAGYGFTCLSAKGACQPVKILFMIAKRKDIKPILNIIKNYNPNAVYTIEDVRSVNAATFPHLQPVHKKIERKFLKYTRKGK
ncbi:DUF2179 domain-containing protein [candidate division FCPU426 bacterium]|nr:DUF2179 domain-containing protein [candidate division FCPU426 bacterium]